MRNKIKFILFLCIISALQSQDEAYKKIFDPNQHRDIQPKWPVIMNNVLDIGNVLDSILFADSVQWITEGFRVQVLATKSISKADSLSNSLGSVISDSIYIVYETPNYKVRVGDYIARKTAEKVRQALIERGYASAWVIRTRITPQQTVMIIRSAQ